MATSVMSWLYGPKHPASRFILVFLTFLGLIALILLKLMYIQFIDAENLKKKALRTRNQSISLFNRGRILDRNGVILAQDGLVYDIYAHPSYYRGVPPEVIAKHVAPVLNMPVNELAAKLSEPEFTIRLGKNIPKKTVEQLRKLRITWTDKHNETSKIRVPGLDFVKKPVRNYPQGTLAAHILGYVNDEADVSAGIEYSARDILKQVPVGMKQMQLDGRGDFIHLEQLDPKAVVTVPKSEDVKLTLDSRLQYVAERELAAGIVRTKADRGCVIALNPKNGEMLAFAVYPSYEPDKFLKTDQAILKNWATTDVYPPGSTFKILTVASGLETKVINEASRILDTGRMEIGGWMIQNYDYRKHPNPGLIDLVYLFQHSSNIASAKIAMSIPVEEHWKMLSKFGMGKRTGIDLPGESRGILNPPENWDQTTHATIGFGYGLAATPMQMAAAVAAIANDGVWTTPHLIKGQKNVVRRRVLTPETARSVTRLLTESIATAKTSTVKLEQFNVAGKTGTSRKPNDNGRGYKNELFTSFVGYYPAEDPKVLIMVVVDSPRTAESWGSTVAGPIFKTIADESIGYLGLKPVTVTR